MSRGPDQGWYPNPEVVGEIRWWDGKQWTAHTGPDPIARTPATDSGPLGEGPPPPTAPHSQATGSRALSDWVTDTFNLFGARAGHIFTLVVVLGLVPSLVQGLALYSVFRNAEIEVLADNGGVNVSGVSPSGWIVVSAAVVISLITDLVLSSAVCRQIQLARTDNPEIWSASLVPSFRRLPRVLGVQMLVLLLLMIGMVVISLIVGVLAQVHPATLLATIPAAIGATVYLVARLSMTLTTAAMAPKGISSIPNSLHLSAGNFVSILRRLLALLVFGSIAGLILSMFSSIGITAEPIEMDSAIDQSFDWETVFGDNPTGFFLSVILGGVGQALLLSLLITGLVVLYGDLGGSVAEDLTSPADD